MPPAQSCKYEPKHRGRFVEEVDTTTIRIVGRQKRVNKDEAFSAPAIVHLDSGSTDSMPEKLKEIIEEIDALKKTSLRRVGPLLMKKLTLLLAEHKVGMARALFDRYASIANAFHWSKMISGYVQLGIYDEAIALFDQMLKSKVQPDLQIFMTVLRAYAHKQEFFALDLLLGRVAREGYTVDEKFLDYVLRTLQPVGASTLRTLNPNTGMDSSSASHHYISQTHASGTSKTSGAAAEYAFRVVLKLLHYRDVQAQRARLKEHLNCATTIQTTLSVLSSTQNLAMLARIFPELAVCISPDDRPTDISYRPTYLLRTLLAHGLMNQALSLFNATVLATDSVHPILVGRLQKALGESGFTYASLRWFIQSVIPRPEAWRGDNELSRTDVMRGSAFTTLAQSGMFAFVALLARIERLRGVVSPFIDLSSKGRIGLFNHIIHAGILQEYVRTKNFRAALTYARSSPAWRMNPTIYSLQLTSALGLRDSMSELAELAEIAMLDVQRTSLSVSNELFSSKDEWTELLKVFMNPKHPLSQGSVCEAKGMIRHGITLSESLELRARWRATVNSRHAQVMQEQQTSGSKDTNSGPNSELKPIEVTHDEVSKEIQGLRMREFDELATTVNEELDAILQANTELPERLNLPRAVQDHVELSDAKILTVLDSMIAQFDHAQDVFETYLITVNRLSDHRQHRHRPTPSDRDDSTPLGFALGESTPVAIPNDPTSLSRMDKLQRRVASILRQWAGALSECGHVAATVHITSFIARRLRGELRTDSLQHCLRALARATVTRSRRLANLAAGRNWNPHEAVRETCEVVPGDSVALKIGMLEKEDRAAIDVVSEAESIANDLRLDTRVFSKLLAKNRCDEERESVLSVKAIAMSMLGSEVKAMAMFEGISESVALERLLAHGACIMDPRSKSSATLSLPFLEGSIEQWQYVVESLHSRLRLQVDGQCKVNLSQCPISEVTANVEPPNASQTALASTPSHRTLARLTNQCLLRISRLWDLAATDPLDPRFMHDIGVGFAHAGDIASVLAWGKPLYHNMREMFSTLSPLSTTSETPTSTEMVESYIELPQAVVYPRQYDTSGTNSSSPAGQPFDPLDRVASKIIAAVEVQARRQRLGHTAAQQLAHPLDGTQETNTTSASSPPYIAQAILESYSVITQPVPFAPRSALFAPASDSVYASEFASIRSLSQLLQFAQQESSVDAKARIICPPGVGEHDVYVVTRPVLDFYFNLFTSVCVARRADLALPLLLRLLSLNETLGHHLQQGELVPPPSVADTSTATGFAAPTPSELFDSPLVVGTQATGKLGVEDSNTPIGGINAAQALSYHDFGNVLQFQQPLSYEEILVPALDLATSLLASNHYDVRQASKCAQQYVDYVAQLCDRLQMTWRGVTEPKGSETKLTFEELTRGVKRSLNRGEISGFPSSEASLIDAKTLYTNVCTRVLNDLQTRGEIRSPVVLLTQSLLRAMMDFRAAQLKFDSVPQLLDTYRVVNEQYAPHDRIASHATSRVGNVVLPTLALRRWHSGATRRSGGSGGEVEPAKNATKDESEAHAGVTEATQSLALARALDFTLRASAENPVTDTLVGLGLTSILRVALRLLPDNPQLRGKQSDVHTAVATALPLLRKIIARRHLPIANMPAALGVPVAESPNRPHDARQDALHLGELPYTAHYRDINNEVGRVWKRCEPKTPDGLQALTYRSNVWKDLEIQYSQRDVAVLPHPDVSGCARFVRQGEWLHEIAPVFQKLSVTSKLDSEERQE